MDTDELARFLYITWWNKYYSLRYPDSEARYRWDNACKEEQEAWRLLAAVIKDSQHG
jgi:hypothetical protein